MFAADSSPYQSAQWSLGELPVAAIRRSYRASRKQRKLRAGSSRAPGARNYAPGLGANPGKTQRYHLKAPQMFQKEPQPDSVVSGIDYCDSAVALGHRELRYERIRRGGHAPNYWSSTGMASILGVNFSGFFAWWLWRTIYLSVLPLLKKKVRVALDWILGRASNVPTLPEN